VGCFVLTFSSPTAAGNGCNIAFSVQAEKGSPSNVAQGMKEVKDQVLCPLFGAPVCGFSSDAHAIYQYRHCIGINMYLAFYTNAMSVSTCQDPVVVSTSVLVSGLINISS
jgi:hypothetical protein